MRQPAGEPGLRERKLAAIMAIACWLVALGLLFGPARWELGHSYAHWIEGAEENLPTLTRKVALPVLGIEPSGLSSWLIFLVFWGYLWLTPIAMTLLVRRVPSRERLIETLVLMVFGYSALAAVLLVPVLLGLTAPFLLL